MPTARGEQPGAGADRPVDSAHFPDALLYNAARLYYLEDATQAEIAARLGMSRATVSRVLAAARHRGIVRIEVVPPGETDSAGLADRLARALGLDRVFLSGALAIAGRSVEDQMGAVLAPAVDTALAAAGLVPGDVLLVSSGRTMYEVARSELAAVPGVVVAPTVGGNDQPEGWYQTNEITRLMASRLGGRATYLFAPAMPGPELFRSLHEDPAIQRVLHLWPQATVALMGIGAPPALRRDMPAFVASGDATLRGAVGDVCSRFFDRQGHPLAYPGSDRLIALELTDLTAIPIRIGVAVGADKLDSIRVAARAGYLNQLVTDPGTAQLLLDSDSTRSAS